MKTIDYLFESAHPAGTYSSLIPSVECKEELYAYCAKLGIENLVEPDEYHCTLIYSKHACPDVAHENFNLPCKALPIGFRILGTDKKVLVLELYCPNATRLHELFMGKHNATHDYPEYIPHITIASDFDDKVPIEVPEIEIEFSGMTVEELS
jgi:2'-5' RNA ligase